MKLYLIHCGFYHPIAGDGIYELHTNLFVVAKSFDDAKAKAKALPEFKAKKMHIDGMQEIEQVQGYSIKLERAGRGSTETVIHNKKSFYA